MSADKKTMTVEELRMVMIEGTSRVWTSAFEAAVRKDANDKWREAIAKEVQYQKYARSAIGESAVVALANVLEKMK